MPYVAGGRRESQLAAEHVDVAPGCERCGAATEDIVAHVRIAVEQQDEVAASQCHALIATSCEADVLRILDDVHVRKRFSNGLCRVIRRRVVDNNHLEGDRVRVIVDLTEYR